jgi:hypothetical protein
VLTYATHWLTDKQKADLICEYLKDNGPSNYQQICEGTVPQMNYGQFVRGVSYINHTMQTVWGTPFGWIPGTNLYQFPELWDENIHIIAFDLKYIRTRMHKVASNLTASLAKAEKGGPWAADEVEIENLLIGATRFYEDMERTLKHVAKRHGVSTGVKLPSL